MEELFKEIREIVNDLQEKSILQETKEIFKSQGYPYAVRFYRSKTGAGLREAALIVKAMEPDLQ